MEKDYLLDYYNLALKQKAKDKFGDYYINCMDKGSRTYYLKHLTETKNFDETWVNAMMSYFPAIDQIIKNPKFSFRYEEEVVPIEKAKKTTSSSVRHLASHTQYLRQSDGDNVIPKKILNVFTEEEIATYENRFIMTLIDRCYLFIRSRQEIVEANVDSYEQDHLVFESKSTINEENIVMNIDLRIKKPLANKAINEHNHELLAKVNRLYVLITGYKNSNFMKRLAGARKVTPPIMKTNVILKNVYFKDAYQLWLFLDRYSALAFNLDQREKKIKIGSSLREDLDYISSLAYSAYKENKRTEIEQYEGIENLVPVNKKTTKIINNLVSDKAKNPDMIGFADSNISEYYLELNKKAVTRRVEALMDSSRSDKAKATQMIKEGINITNAMFDSMFTLENNIDYFEDVMTNKNPEEALKQAKYKLVIAKTIRGEKEKDVKKSLKLELALYRTYKKALISRIAELNAEKEKAKTEKVIEKFEKKKEALVKERNQVTKNIKKTQEKLDNLAIAREKGNLASLALKEKIELDAQNYKDKTVSKTSMKIDELKEALSAQLKEEQRLLSEALRLEVERAKLLDDTLDEALNPEDEEEAKALQKESLKRLDEQIKKNNASLDELRGSYLDVIKSIRGE